MIEGYLCFFVITSLVNAIVSFILAVFVIFTGYKKRLARYLFYFCGSVALWSFPYFLWQISSTSEYAFFWSRMLMFGAVFTSLSYLHLVIVFLGKDKERFYRVVLSIFYLFSLLWVVLNATTNLFVVGVEPRSFFPFWPIPGPFFIPFLSAFAGHVLYATYLLAVAYRKAKGNKRKQIKLMLFGNLIAFIGGATNYPLWFHINIAPWGNIAVALYAIITVYSIMRYKFLDLRVVMAELFTGIILVIFFGDVFLSRSVPELGFRLLALVVMGLFSFVLVKSVRLEVDRREEVTQLAKSLERANIQLQQLDEQKTEFLSIASHQLRTPLSILKGYIELLKDGAFGKPTKKMVATLADMDETNERLVKLVDDFLDITRIEQGRTLFVFDMHSMNNLITSVVAELRDRAIAAEFSLSWVPPKGIDEVYMDDEKIRHVVFNFVDNAIKYGLKGTINVMFEKKDGGYVVSVKDNGIGFMKEDQVNFFYKFYRGKNVQGTNVNGTGLGIYVCRKFVETHNGYVWASSPGLGKGSEFGFYLPGGVKKRKEVLDGVTKVTSKASPVG
ncbi:MAG: hypothetical protein GW775_02025 [Candidatus Magasanikbacteria bacterium]|nr:hypothetical protein [Candidatus Magasanikbacteria bacterium]